jgi:hypothetical protein
MTDEDRRRDAFIRGFQSAGTDSDPPEYRVVVCVGWASGAFNGTHDHVLLITNNPALARGLARFVRSGYTAVRVELAL